MSESAGQEGAKKNDQHKLKQCVTSVPEEEEGRICDAKEPVETKGWSIGTRLGRSDAIKVTREWVGGRS
eukprot:12936679-Prorocentrum_lima.AAC.1